MANRYHINPQTGGAGVCTATAGRCPFGGEEVHHDSPEAARQAFELSMGTSFRDPNAARVERYHLGQEAREAINEALGQVLHFELDESEIQGHLDDLDGIMGSEAWSKDPASLKADLETLRENLEQVGHGHNGHYMNDAGYLDLAGAAVGKAEEAVADLISKL